MISEPHELRRIEAVPFRYFVAGFFEGKPDHALPSAVLGANVDGGEGHRDVDTVVEPFGIPFAGRIKDPVVGGFVFEFLHKSFFNVLDRTPLRFGDRKMWGEGTNDVPMHDRVATHIPQGGEGVGYIFFRGSRAYMSAEHAGLGPASNGKALCYARVDAGFGGLAHGVFDEALVCCESNGFDRHRDSL